MSNSLGSKSEEPKSLESSFCLILENITLDELSTDQTNINSMSNSLGSKSEEPKSLKSSFCRILENITLDEVSTEQTKIDILLLQRSQKV